MAAKNEEIDDGLTVQVGGMEGLVKDDKTKTGDLEVEIEDPKTTQRATREPVRESEDEREEDARLAYDEGTDDEIEERGLSRRQRRNRQRRTVVAGRDQVIDQLNAKVEALTNMIGQMGQSQVGITIGNIDTQLGAAQQALSLADGEIKKAVAAGDLGRYDELQALKQEAQARVWQLSQQRRGIQAELEKGGRPRTATNGGAPAGPPAPANNTLDRRTQDFTETFMSRFDFDPNSADETTLIIKAIDDSVAAEGYRSNTPLYWRTLEKKLAARGIYPVDDNDDGDDRRDQPARREAPARRANGGRPPTAGGSNNRRGSGTTFRLDPMMRDYLDSEGILTTDGLNDDQKARRSRLIKNWSEGMRKLERGEINR